ncbi:MFS transporter [Actinokineospora sp. PR83]|uniref:MFS transporter n=1 Tax=Actinokineospora sp. PR83 TaxID=2884908 RepID=UPI0027E099E8|nr:MFS transporter [Actinokineospora sp. PR83]
MVGRLGYGRLSRASGVRVRTAVVLPAATASTVALGLSTWAVALVVAAVVAGAARGVFTLVQATAVTDRWGAAHYGHLNGLLSAATTISMALAPWAGAAVAGVVGGYPTTVLLLAALTVVGAAVTFAADPERPRRGVVPRRAGR